MTSSEECDGMANRSTQSEYSLRALRQIRGR